MHELALLGAVVDAVQKAVDAAGAASVEAVGLRVGSLSGALPDALLGAWPIVSGGTVMAGARLEIESVPAAVWCTGCACEQEVDEFFALTCPACGTPTGHLVRGREFEVAFADLASPDLESPDLESPDLESPDHG